MGFDNPSAKLTARPEFQRGYIEWLRQESSIPEHTIIAWVPHSVGGAYRCPRGSSSSRVRTFEPSDPTHTSFPIACNYSATKRNR